MLTSTTLESSLESTCASVELSATSTRTPNVPVGSHPPPGETRDQWLDRLQNTPLHLCRIRYFGNEDRWSFAWYTYAHEKYQPSLLITGEEHGTPEEAFATSAHFL